MNEYEIELIWKGKGKKPAYTETAYGFNGNPPIVIHARNVTNAKKKLKLPKSVRIRKITKI